MVIVESNMEAFQAGVGPFTHGSKVHTDLMKTQALLHALDKYKFDAAFGGARRDEEKSRAKERIFSFRDKFHQWIQTSSITRIIIKVQQLKKKKHEKEFVSNVGTWSHAPHVL